MELNSFAINSTPMIPQAACMDGKRLEKSRNSKAWTNQTKSYCLTHSQRHHTIQQMIPDLAKRMQRDKFNKWMMTDYGLLADCILWDETLNVRNTTGPRSGAERASGLQSQNDTSMYLKIDQNWSKRSPSTNDTPKCCRGQEVQGKSET